MFCGKCGTNNADNSQFCANCGTPLEQQQPAEQDAAVQQMQYTTEQPKKRKKGLIIGLICGGVALIGAIVLVLCLCLCGSSWALEPGMSQNEVQQVMQEQGFTRDYDDSEECYEGQIENVGPAEVRVFYEADKLCALYIETDPNALLKFLQEEMDFEQHSKDGITVYIHDEDGIFAMVNPSDSDCGYFMFEEYVNDGMRMQLEMSRMQLENAFGTDF